jgi:hypothetical protein
MATSLTGAILNEMTTTNNDEFTAEEQEAFTAWLMSDELMLRARRALHVQQWQTIATLEAEITDDDIGGSDGGASMVVEVMDRRSPRVWVPITSYVENRLPDGSFAHPEIERMRGKRVRVTIEVFE